MRTRILTIVVLLASVGFSRAQQENAQLSGSIVDQTGAAIAGATVTIADPLRGLTRSVTSDPRGEYRFALLPPGDRYVLRVTMQGFKPTVQQNLALQVAQNATVNVTLSAGAEATTVTVNAEAPLLETESSSQGQVITGDSVSGLPLELLRFIRHWVRRNLVEESSSRRHTVDQEFICGCAATVDSEV